MTSKCKSWRPEQGPIRVAALNGVLFSDLLRRCRNTKAVATQTAIRIGIVLATGTPTGHGSFTRASGLGRLAMIHPSGPKAVDQAGPLQGADQSPVFEGA
jgi:hypothetical protein